MKNRKRNLITIDLSGCKNMNECIKVIDVIGTGRVKIDVTQIKTPLSN
jgi:hypothetical protein